MSDQKTVDIVVCQIKYIAVDTNGLPYYREEGDYGSDYQQPLQVPFAGDQTFNIFKDGSPLKFLLINN